MCAELEAMQSATAKLSEERSAWHAAKAQHYEAALLADRERVALAAISVDASRKTQETAQAALASQQSDLHRGDLAATVPLDPLQSCWCL